MYYLISAILFGAGFWLLVQGIKHSNRKRNIVGVLLMAIALATVGMFIWREEIHWFKSFEQQTQYGLLLAIQAGDVIAKASTITAVLLLFIWSMDNRFIRRFTILAIAIGGTWWGVQNWSEFMVMFNRVANAISDTVFG